MTDTRDLAIVPEPDFSGVLATQQSRAVFLPENLGQAMELAHFMAGGIGVRQWMRGNPSACLALIQISMRWGMDPYIVANKAYYANDTLSFEAQLVNAVLNTSGHLIGRLKVEFSGDAGGGVGKETLNCRVSGRIKADPEQLFTHEQPLQSITVRNSPLWKSNPRQQLQYYTTRAWARLYLPEVLLGIYTPDEIADGAAQRLEDQSTPRDATKAPDRRSFQETADPGCFGKDVIDAEVEEIETVLPAETSDVANSEPRTDRAEEAAVDGAGHGVSNQPSGNAVGSEGDEFGSSATGSGEPAVDKPAADLPLLDMVPRDKPEWGMWRREVVAAIEDITERAAYDRFRARINPALDKADDALQGEIQDLLADKLVTLPEKAK